jgi:5'-3' exonuclease
LVVKDNYYLLPKNIEEQIKDKILLDADFIEEFETDMDGKYQEYEAICLVPFVSYDKIKKIFEGVTYTEEQDNKLKTGYVYEFK